MGLRGRRSFGSNACRRKYLFGYARFVLLSLLDSQRPLLFASLALALRLRLPCRRQGCLSCPLLAVMKRLETPVYLFSARRFDVQSTVLLAANRDNVYATSSSRIRKCLLRC